MAGGEADHRQAGIEEGLAEPAVGGGVTGVGHRVRSQKLCHLSVDIAVSVVWGPSLGSGVASGAVASPIPAVSANRLRAAAGFPNNS